jgi:FHS family L-fucose permease-like MFS transporter
MANVNVEHSVSPTVALPSTCRVALAGMTTLFFMWGLITELNDVLVPHAPSFLPLSIGWLITLEFITASCRLNKYAKT